MQYEDSTSITFVRPVRYGAHVALTLRCSCGSTELSANATLEPQRTGQRNGANVAKFGKLYGATQAKRKSHTSTGRKFALVEGLSHDSEFAPDRFIMSILRGRCGTVNYHPVSRFNKLKSFSGEEIDQNHVAKRILGGKGCSTKTQQA